MTFSNFQCVTYLNCGRFKLKMSGDFHHGGGGSTGSDGAINPGFDPLGAATTGGTLLVKTSLKITLCFHPQNPCRKCFKSKKKKYCVVILLYNSL